MTRSPQRIVCLSAEIADWLWRLGAWDRVAGVTAHFNAPSETPRKPRVSGFSSANMEGILKLQPDLAITFSDVQAGLAAALMKRGLPVLATNQRTLAETGATLALVARIVQREAEGEALLQEIRRRLAPVENPGRRPKVYFEEWHEPLITGIAWVGELIELAGGEDVFSGLRQRRSAPDRVIAPEVVLSAEPEIILASWCGEPVKAEVIQSRPGWHQMPAVRTRRIFEIPGDEILQPGFRLIEGYERMKEIIRQAGGNP